MVALLVGSVLAALGLAFVLMPLMRPPSATTVAAPAEVPDLPPEASALEALREIEFDQATGKLSPEDYATLKATYTPLALAELKARESTDTAAQGAAPGTADAPGAVGAGDATAVDPAEALIARMRSRAPACSEHGARPEPDAMFCSDCGRFLGAACPRCGEPAERHTARFCVSCGAALVA